MKKKHLFFAVLFLAALAFGFVGCENPDDESGISIEKPREDSTNSNSSDSVADGNTKPTKVPKLVVTGGATDVGRSSVTLWGRINTDTLWAFNNIKWGMEYATSKEEIYSHIGKKSLFTEKLVGENSDEYYVVFSDVVSEDWVYYNSYVLIDDIKYIYGRMDSVHLLSRLTLLSNNKSYGRVFSSCCHGGINDAEKEGTSDYPFGSEVTIIVSPEENCYFVGWGDYDGDELTRTIILTSDSIIIANFASASFSISSTKQVYFSSGNLQYNPANDDWRFAENQTDYIGSINTNISAIYNGWIDLFGWGTGADPTEASKDFNDYQNFVDWGKNRIEEDDPDTWRALTKSEWEYLLNSRANSSALIGVAQVNGVNGLILLPDNWFCPSGITFKSGFHNSYSVHYYAAYQTFTGKEWSKMESVGAVFLPAAGVRYSSTVNDVQVSGNYWSADKYNSINAHYFGFNTSGAYLSNTNRYVGNSVRLVKDL
ncbi:MAG: hypothetical protein J6P95_05335 [Paludibacteraceae bacterium]|nr:hypothetical protein [Paludibacteraceae bacterium]